MDRSNSEGGASHSARGRGRGRGRGRATVRDVAYGHRYSDGPTRQAAIRRVVFAATVSRGSSEVRPYFSFENKQ